MEPMTPYATIYLSVVALTYIHLLFYCIRYVKRYNHEFDSNTLTTSVVIVCLLVVLLTTFLLPADIFLASIVKTQDGSFQLWATNQTLAKIDYGVYASYYALYGTVIFMLVILLPFMHFMNDPTVSSNRCSRALKLTFWFALSAIVLLAVGAFVPTTQKTSTNDDHGNNTKATDNSTADNSFTIVFNKAQDAINLIMTFITFFGLVNMVFYTASGIVSWPLGLMYGNLRISSRTTEINERELDLRLRITTLEDKARTGALSNREQDALIRARSELRVLEQEESTLNEYSTSLSYKLRMLIRPMQILFGLVVLLLALLIVVNLIIVGYDRLVNGEGPQKGYILKKSTLVNPMQFVFTKVHNMIFIGPIPLLVVCCILVVATISGMRNLGLWFLVARVYKIKVRRTQPQAMLYFCACLMLSVLSFSVLFYSLTPEYVTYGNQSFKKVEGNQTLVMPCTLGESTGDCVRTRSSILLTGMMSQVWIFGAVFYWMTWMFVAMSIVSFIVFVVRGKREAAHGLIDNENDFQE